MYPVLASSPSRPVNSSPDDELGSHYNQGATTSDIALVAPQMRPLDLQIALDRIEALNRENQALRDELGACYHPRSFFDSPQALHDAVTAPNIARMPPQIQFDDYRVHFPLDPFPLNHVQRPDCPLSPPDLLLDHLRFDSSPNALSTTDPAPRAQCEFKMYRPNPPNGDPIEVRTEKLFELDVSLRTGPDKATLPWKFIRISNIGPVERSGIRRRRASLDLVLEAFGATTGTPFTSACPKCSKKGPRCSKKGPSGPPNYSLFDFVAKNNLVEVTERNARIAFRFRCLPRHHGTTDTEYRLTATISDGGQILGQYQYPNWLRIVHHLSRGKDRPPVALQQANEAPSVVGLGESEESHVPYAFTQTHRANEESEPGWRGSGLPAPASAARSNNSSHEKFPVLSHISLRRGPIKGGDEIYLIVQNLPPTTVLYARFGGKIVSTSHIAPGVLSCRLPAAVHPGVVEVTLCQTPSLDDEGYGKSLVLFEYETDPLAVWLNTIKGGNAIDPRMKLGSATSPGILTTSHLDV